MSMPGRTRRLRACLVIIILVLIAGFFVAMRRAREHLAEEAYRTYLGAEGEMTEQERQQLIDDLMDDIRSTR